MEFLRKLANGPRLLIGVITLNVIACGEIYALLEGKGPIQGPWWALVTASTVGYGDLYPASTVGRGIAGWLIVTSIAFVAMGTAQLTNHLLTDPNAWTDDEQKQLLSDVKTILENQEKMMNDGKDARVNDE